MVELVFLARRAPLFGKFGLICVVTMVFVGAIWLILSEVSEKETRKAVKRDRELFSSDVTEALEEEK